tara:strand:+ start:382 stop:603 length:222 start_codon:yes stop_codon:yes gene_type:complete
MNTYPAQQDELQKQQAIKNAAAIGAFVGVFAKPLVLMLLWNWLMPGLFGLATIGYLKAFALWMISRILFDTHD